MYGQERGLSYYFQGYGLVKKIIYGVLLFLTIIFLITIAQFVFFFAITFLKFLLSNVFDFLTLGIFKHR